MKIVKVRYWETFDGMSGQYSPTHAVVPDDFPDDKAGVSQRRRGTFAYDAQNTEWPCFGHGESEEEAAKDAAPDEAP